MPESRTRLPLAAPVLLLFALLAPARARAVEPSPNARPISLSLHAPEAHAAVLSAARAWASDAVLVYAESRDSVLADGTARGWSFVFWSPAMRTSRGLTVRTGGGLEAFAFTSPFDPPTIEDGWLDPSAILAVAEKDPQARPRIRGHAALVLSRGLITAGAPRTVWLLTEPEGNAEWIFDALRGSGGRRNLTPPPSGAADVQAPAARSGMPPYLGAQRTRFDARIVTLHAGDATADRDRARWLGAREADALVRLAGQDAAWDSLGRSASNQAAGGLAADLSALARWHERSTQADSALAAGRLRIAAAQRDLAAARPTQIAVYLSSEKRARPARVSVLVDGAEVGRARWGDPEWRALDAGGWAEIARATVRPGAKDVRIEIEDGDRRISAVTWKGTLEAGSLRLLRVRLPGPSEGIDPTIDAIASASARP